MVLTTGEKAQWLPFHQGVSPRFCLLHSLFAEACSALTPAFHNPPTPHLTTTTTSSQGPATKLLNRSIAPSRICYNSLH
ncbi:unnamed protein product [Coregonus sp. 'balchen']|nr:unnamed protein product [Coregonus sp. 'balchen']